MNRIYQALATFITVHVAVYLYGAFIVASFDYQEWSRYGRALLSLIAVLSGTGAAALVYWRPR